MTKPVRFTCLVCGYPDLTRSPYEETEGGSIPSFSLCPCCGIEYGFDDDPGACGEDLAPHVVGEHSTSNAAYRRAAHLELRRRWVEGGMRWWSDTPVPPTWNPLEQLRRLRGNFADRT